MRFTRSLTTAARNPRRRATPGRVAAELFDALESRLALYTSPLLTDLPSLSDMADPNNTVVRVQTSLGIVDIELYDQSGPGSAPAAPITTANFLSYISRGRYEDTFFHRLVDGFVLQGGGFGVSGTTATEVQTDPPIQNEFDAGRSNIERTIAMAKLGGNPDSATSQFFFNLGDNASNLDTQNGGFTVFGRVIQGWDVVLAISDLTVQDLSGVFTGPGTGAFTDVPVSNETTHEVVRVVDIEVLKHAETQQFYTTAVYFPDGYRSPRIVSNLDLVNPDPNADIVYEVIARFENGSRDKVITQGVLTAGTRIRIPISRGGDPSINNVRADAPFSYEVRATGAIAASLNHKDFGAIGGESFLSTDGLGADQLRSWTFAFGQKGPGVFSFLTFESLAGVQNLVTATFFSDNGNEHAISVPLAAYRRGGLNISDMAAVPDGVYSVTVTSTSPIVAALSQYRAAPGRASLETGQPGGGGVEGVLPGALIPSDGQSLISVVYAGASGSVTVDFDFVLADGTVLTGPSQSLSNNNRRIDFDLSLGNGALPRDQQFTVRYRVQGGANEVAASYTSITAGDTIRADFQSLSTSTVYFADGFTDPAEAGSEIISLYNPFRAAGSTTTYRVRFFFVDANQDIIAVDSEIIAPAGLVNIDVRALPGVMSRIQSDPRFHRYSVSITTSTIDGSSGSEGAVFAQMTRVSPSGDVITTGPTLSSALTALSLDDPRFDP